MDTKTQAETPLTRLTDEILFILVRDALTGLVLEEAFDVIDHEFHLRKSSINGSSTSAINGFKSCLT